MREIIIGVTPHYEPAMQTYMMRANYLSSVSAAGAVPAIMPALIDEVDRLADTFDGYLFIGGPDVHPSLYGQPLRTYCGDISDARDEFEIAMLKAVLARKKPVLAICRGIQVMNVALGGTLYQDLFMEHPSCINHSMERPYNRMAHDVILTSGEPLAELLGREKLGVNSCHHQAIRTLAPGLKEMARSTDRLIEAVYLPDQPFAWGVQWHPEHTTLVDEASLSIFKALVDAARANA